MNNQNNLANSEYTQNNIEVVSNQNVDNTFVENRNEIVDNNCSNVQTKHKKTLSISHDSKVMLIVIGLIFIFIMFLPVIYDFFN